MRRHPQTLAIFILNLLASWTFICWIGAIVCAFIKPASMTIITPNQSLGQ
jgi:hypothetical protein